MSQTGQPQTHSFEDAVGELENIIAQMEEGKMTLESTLKHYKRGTELLKFCQHQLANAQQQVSILEGDILKPLSESQIES